MDLFVILRLIAAFVGRVAKGGERLGKGYGERDMGKMGKGGEVGKVGALGAAGDREERKWAEYGRNRKLLLTLVSCQR